MIIIISSSSSIMVVLVYTCIYNVIRTLRILEGALRDPGQGLARSCKVLQGGVFEYIWFISDWAHF